MVSTTNLRVVQTKKGEHVENYDVWVYRIFEDILFYIANKWHEFFKFVFDMFYFTKVWVHDIYKKHHMSVLHLS